MRRVHRHDLTFAWPKLRYRERL